MTIRLLAAYGVYPQNAIVTLDAGTEAGLIAAGQASTTLTGGVTYVAPVAPPIVAAAVLSADANGNGAMLKNVNGSFITIGGNTTNFVPQDFDVHNLAFDEPFITMLGLPSPYPSIEHAYLVPVYSNAGWNGYHFWGAAAPFPASNPSKENPCIYVSQDGEKWVTAPGVTNPIFGPPAVGNYADPSFVFSADGSTLYLSYVWENAAATIPGGYSYAIMCSSSTNGSTWTTPVVIYGTTVSSSRPDSPSLYWNPITAQWNCTMFIGPGTSISTVSTSNTNPMAGPGVWSGVVVNNVVHPMGRTWWHGHFIAVSSGGACKIVGTLQDNNSAGGNLYTASSNDSGANFSVQHLTAFDNSVAGGSQYKMSLCLIPDIAKARIISYVSRIGGLSAQQNSVTWVIQKATMSLEGGNIQAKNAFLRDMTNRQVSLGNGVLVSDSFNRTASVAGTTDNGIAWSLASGTWSTNGTTISPDVTNNCVITLDPKIQDFYAEVKIATLGVTYWFIFNRVDANNFWRVGTQASSPTLQKIAAGGVVINFSAGSAAFVAGDILGVERRGNYIMIYKNDLFYDSFLDASYVGATLMGLQGSGATAVAFDNFIVKRGRN